MSQPEDEAKTLLGFNPNSKQPSADIFGEALKEIRDEQDQKRKGIAKELLIKQMTLATEIENIDRANNEKLGKMRKELAKLNNRVRAMSQGQPPPKEEEQQEQPQS